MAWMVASSSGEHASGARYRIQHSEYNNCAGNHLLWILSTKWPAHHQSYKRYIWEYHFPGVCSFICINNVTLWLEFLGCIGLVAWRAVRKAEAHGFSTLIMALVYSTVCPYVNFKFILGLTRLQESNSYMLWVSDSHYHIAIRDLINIVPYSDMVVDCFSHPWSRENFTESWQAWNGGSTLHPNNRTRCGALLLALVFLNSVVPIFLQEMAVESSLVVWAPSTSSVYVIVMGFGCGFRFMGGAPEHLFPVQR